MTNTNWMQGNKNGLTRAVMELVQIASPSLNFSPQQTVSAIVDKFWPVSTDDAKVAELTNSFFMNFSTQENQVEFGLALESLVEKVRVLR